VFVKLSVNFICFAWLVHCFDIVELFLATFYWCSSSSFSCAFLLLCWCVLLVFVVAHCVSLLISIPFYVLLLFVMFCWWSSLPFCYILLVVINAPHCTCWRSLLPSCCNLFVLCLCSLLSSCYVLLVFIDTPCYTLLMFVMASLLHFIGVPCHPLVALCWCLLIVFCCALIDASRGPLVVFYWSLLTLACCVLLLLFWPFLLINIPLLCSIVAC
jgi:hypothetical protein